MFKLNRLFWSLIICSSVFVTTAVVTTTLTSCNEKNTSPDYSKLSDYVGKSDGSDWITLDDNGNKNIHNGITGTVTCEEEDDHAVLSRNNNFKAHNLVIPKVDPKK
ncbi:MAG: hypothetical protein LBH55_03520 [Mycoplasmataceae bacterium]|nr:hypothetical protein [Mycoplasmataceae bacterium]